MKRLMTVSGVFMFLLFLLLGGAWVSLVNFLPQDVPRGLLTVVMGMSFVGVFLWDLVIRVQNILGGTEQLSRPLLLTILNVVLLLLAFAAIYYQFGIIDTTRRHSPIVGATHSEPGGRLLPEDVTTENGNGRKDSQSSEEEYSKFHQFALCVYYSVVTFTTLGYGDFQPIGWGRAMAGMEAIVGYLVLGILASTSASLLQASATKE